LLNDQYSLSDYLNFNAKETKKTKPIQRPGYWGQRDVESENKNCASYNWSVRNG